MSVTSALFIAYLLSIETRADDVPRADDDPRRVRENIPLHPLCTMEAQPLS